MICGKSKDVVMTTALRLTFVVILKTFKALRKTYCQHARSLIKCSCASEGNQIPIRRLLQQLKQGVWHKPIDHVYLKQQLLPLPHSYRRFCSNN